MKRYYTDVFAFIKLSSLQFTFAFLMLPMSTHEGIVHFCDNPHRETCINDIL